MSGRAKRWRLASQVALALLVFAVIFAWSEGLFRRRVGPGSVTGGPAGERYRGPTATVVRRSVREVLEVTGTVRPVLSAVVSPRVSGVVRTVLVQTGDPVREGQPLAALSVPELEAQASAARAAVAGAAASLEQARADLERMDYLREREAATRVEWERARTAVSVGEAELARAKDAARSAQALVAHATLVSPMDGTVALRMVDPGDLAAPGTPTFRIEGSPGLRLEAAVDERWAGRLALGDRLGFVLEATGERGSGAVAEISPTADPSTRTVLVKLALPETAGVRSGAAGRLLLPAGERAALLAPERAVRSVGGLDLVRAVGDGGHLVTRHVRLGRRQEDGLVEILSGVSEGDTLALEAAP